MIIALAALVGVAVLAVLREGAPRGKTADSVTPEPAFEHARGSVVRTLAIAEGKLLARNPLVTFPCVLFLEPSEHRSDLLVEHAPRL